MVRNDRFSLGGIAPQGGEGGGVNVSKRGVHVSGAFFFLNLLLNFLEISSSALFSYFQKIDSVFFFFFLNTPKLNSIRGDDDTVFKY